MFHSYFIVILVDGVWNDWESWSSCSLSCGNGSQSRNRTCIGPYYGGMMCNGSDTEIQECNTHHCPGIVIVYCRELCLHASVYYLFH